MRRSGILRFGGVLLALMLLWIAIAAIGNASSSDAVWPDSPGTVIRRDGKLVIDASHLEDGYFMARVSSATKHRLKMRVVKSDTTLTYDLNSDAEYEVFPLQLGSGGYQVSLYENVTGNKYSAEGKVSLSASLADENAAFLCTNQYVNYAEDSLTVQKSDELCEGKTPAAAYKSVCNFMTSEFVYDFIRALRVTPGMLPEVDPCFEKRMGICQDLSAVMVCMLRVQGIPAKLMIGYADNNYHAWTVAIVDGEELFFDPTAALNAMSKPKNYSIERFY